MGLTCAHVGRPFRAFSCGPYPGLKPWATVYSRFAAKSQRLGITVKTIQLRHQMHVGDNDESHPASNFSATLSACAAMVNAGLQAAEEGKNELSTT